MELTTTQYKPVLKVDPSSQTLIDIFQRSAPHDWAHDEDTGQFSHKGLTVLNVTPVREGQFFLMYGYDEVMRLTTADIQGRLPDAPQL
jgi:hypothetical protein